MAKNAGKVNVVIEAQMKGFNDSMASLAKFGLAFNGLEKAVKLATEPMKKFISMSNEALQAYGFQEKAIIKLNTALKTHGNYSAKASADLQDFASSLQQVTTIGDEAILSMQGLLASVGGLDADGIKKVTPGILDMAAAWGISEQTMAGLVAKTLGSTTNALTRYGIVIDMTASKTDKLAQIQEQLAAQYGGTAQAIASTGVGGLQQISNIIGDIKEKFGSVVDAFLTSGVNDYIKAMLTVFQGSAGSLDGMKQSADLFGKVFIEVMKVSIMAGGKLKKIFLGIKLTWSSIELAFWKAEASMENGIIEFGKAFAKVHLFMAKISDKVFKTHIAKNIQYNIDQMDAYKDALNDHVKGLEQNAITLGQEYNKIDGDVQRLLDNIERVYQKSRETITQTSKITGTTSPTSSGTTGGPNKETDLIGEYDKLKGMIDQNIEASDKFNQRLEWQQSATEELADAYKSLGYSITNAFETGSLKSFGTAFKSLFAGMLDTMGAKYAAVAAPLWFVPGAQGEAAGYTAASLASFAAAAAIRSIPMFAEGGIIQSPVLMTDLATGQPVGIAGEAGNEAIVPMKNGGAGGGINITVNNPIMTDENQLIDFLNGSLRKTEMYNSLIIEGGLSV